MGRIVTLVTVANALYPVREIRCEFLVDTGTAALVLPAAWRGRLGPLPLVRTVDMQMADQRTVRGEVHGPVRIQIAGFDPVINEVVFIDMAPRDGSYEPLLGYVILEQSRAVVDEVGHRLVSVRHLDLKCAGTVGSTAAAERPDDEAA
jgi:hypothetical protein